MVSPTYTGPAHPIGYVELQVSWLGRRTLTDITEITDELRAKGLSENPGLVQHGARLECTADGANIPKYTLYMGFAPPVPSSEPLDPHNLNEAPLPQPGWPEPTDGIAPLGAKEQKF